MMGMRHPNIIHFLGYVSWPPAIVTGALAAAQGRPAAAPAAPPSMPACSLTACVPTLAIAEYCARGSLLQVLRAAKSNDRLAAQLTWPHRLAMVSRQLPLRAVEHRDGRIGGYSHVLRAARLRPTSD